MEEKRKYSRRNTALVFAAAGVYLLLQKSLGFAAPVAILFILLGLYKVYADGQKKGYLLLIVGLILFLSNHFALVFGFLLAVLAYFFFKSREPGKGGPLLRRRRIIESLKWNREPWVLRSFSLWNLVGEMNLDLSLALPEQPETVIVLQGIVGDIDIFVPEDIGLSVSASVIFGQVDVPFHKETGVLNKTEWQSPNYEASGNKVKLIVSYIVGDIDIRVL